MARRYFGTDGVRGVVGETLTAELVERIARAATRWAGADRVLVGRDTRVSGPELEQAVARGIASAGATAVLAGVLPTPAVALQALDLGVVVSASHNPPQYNGVKLFARGGRKLTDADEEAIEALLDGPTGGRGAVERVADARERYVDHVLVHFAADLAGLRVAVDSASGAYAGLAPDVFRRLGADVTAIGNAPDGAKINVGCGATDLRALRQTVTNERCDLGVAFDGDGDRIVAVDERGNPVDGDGILAVLALHLDVDLVAVTTMTNLGFHRLMAEHGIRVVTTDVGDRYVLEALEREGGVLGGEQSGHVIYLRDHVTGDGLVAALLLCRALQRRRLSDAVAVMRRYPQAKDNVRVSRKELTDAILDEVNRTNATRESVRILVRPSGTEPVVRVLAEAPTDEEARALCVTIAALVRRELG